MPLIPGHGPDVIVIDAVQTGQRGPCRVRLAASGPDDSLSRAVVVVELEAVISVSSLPVSPSRFWAAYHTSRWNARRQLGVGPRLQFDGEISPPGLEVFREVFHLLVEGDCGWRPSRRKRSAHSTVPREVERSGVGSNGCRSSPRDDTDHSPDAHGTDCDDIWSAMGR